MNFKSIFSAVALSALMVGCSSDDLDVMPDNSNQGGADSSTVGYLNVDINLPSVNAAGGRASDQSNDQFDDGLASEYAVTSAHLVLFDTDDETSAKVHGVFQFTDLKPWNTDDNIDNVTANAKSVIKIDVPSVNKSLGAIVMLNAPEDLLTKINDEKPTFKAFFSKDYVSGAELANTSADKGFFMTNAPLYDAKSAKARSFVSIPSQSICFTREEALTKTPVEIFVERAVAKINVSTINNGAYDLTLDSDKYVATVTGWDLDITNKKSYIVRNVNAYNGNDGFDVWKDYTSKAGNGLRFYSKASNRIYWALDPNYNTAQHADLDANFNTIKVVSSKAIDRSEYILENTFDVANQMRNRTTRTIIRATLAPEGKDPETFYQIGSSSTIYDKAGMQTLVKSQAVKVLTDKTDAKKYEFASNTSVSATAGEHQLQVGDVNYNGTDLTKDELDALNGALGVITTYKDGICYYVARIQHFGDTYTPWKNGDPTYGDPDVEETNRLYLGRYGVVRNNWYELQISEIRNLGHPTIPEAPSTPDDENNYYISFKVNIHSWAKRVQNVIL